MPSLNVAILGQEAEKRQEAAQALGKKGSVDDLGFYHAVFQGKIVTAIDPAAYPAKLSSLLQALALSDDALMLADSLSPELGEIIVALDSLNFQKAVFVTNSLDLAPLLKNTKLKDCKIFPSFPEAKNYLLAQESIAKEGPAEALVDHCFEVKGVGTVALGFLKQGEVKVHDNLYTAPLGKEVEVKSIQKNDEDVKAAQSGDRVGLSLKGVKSEEMARGTVLSKEPVKTGRELECEVHATPFAKTPLVSGTYHVSLGLQFHPAKLELEKELKAGEKGKAKLVCEKPLAYNSGETLLLCDLNAKGLRILGSAVLH